ncbi:hypothetical protein MANES_13G072350v8 [Manihot esculenta]|uniref:Uncharacterized protein n=3 Tax=Manihot esculenta TaxID=3983 RepID=A0ACB7GKC4_MANES|nr:hypothetical protein MANES_13G072350v8 [Manihot esculenta]KAG8640648.1 hypothetical protein MANES_13G072350v8 [Manihot esculenta]KAG8640649.1 hypothetical protein MANES_13G072350v8 [Manihot esculenta]
MEEEQVTFLIDGETEVKLLISIPTSATIEQLKEKIKEQTGVPVSQQTLLYDNTSLSDSCTIKEGKFCSPIVGVVLDVSPAPKEINVNVTVTCLAFRISVIVNPNKETVIQLKQKVGEIWGIETKDITLWRLSRKMQDHLPLYRYYINEGSDVHFTRTGEPLSF